jgi:hypothetical protein
MRTLEVPSLYTERGFRGEVSFRREIDHNVSVFGSEFTLHTGIRADVT